MTPRIPAPRPLLFAAALILGAAQVPASADVIFNTDFDGDNGTIPADTTLTEGTTQTGAISNNEFRVDVGRARLVYTGEGAGALSDYTVETTFRRALGGGWTGLVARTVVPDSGDPFAGYHVRLNRISDTNHVFELYRLGGSGTALLTSDTLETLYPAAAVWRMTLSVEGQTITGHLYDAGGNEVASVTATDGEFTTGTGGIRSDAGAPSIHQDLSIIPIPEPGSIGLLGAGLFLMRRRP